ncbi:glycoside hydrolase family 3 protein [Streptomyces sp. NPDC001663]|uniref:glycoside hydrolase family 3 protein n=1 Tax=Streptomyces sp. NPDC001663 TaxID=3364597 RepID=UPI0036CDF67A
MTPYQNASLPIETRIEDLLGRMTIAEKVGQMFQTAVPAGPGGALVDAPSGAFHGSTTDLISRKMITHVNIDSASTPLEIARWHNRVQALAAQTGHGIPVTVSTDPRHSFVRTQGVSFGSQGFSQWPESLGLAALDDVETVSAFADAVRREYLAVGIRSALHPQVDLATEPRWGRQLQTFGADAERATAFATAYVRGLQGDVLSSDSVAATTKHFPGGGPQQDGEDPHFPYGREQVYPSGAFEMHLEPFRAAIAAGTANMMPYYGMPVGLTRQGRAIEEVGFGFNHDVIQGLLRTELGYDGVVVTDWGLIHQDAEGDLVLPARAWGVEDLDARRRIVKAIDAGVDQFGGETCTDLLIDLVEQGEIALSRIDESVRRLLRVKFRLGLFDNPYVDESAVEDLVGTRTDMTAGFEAQARSVTLLKDDGAALRNGRLPAGSRVWVDGIDVRSLTSGITTVDSLDDADVAIIRAEAPFTPRNSYYFESSFHAGSLEFTEGFVTHLQSVAQRVPVILDVFLERPALLAPLLPVVSTLTASYGCSDEAYLAALTGPLSPEGVLPFEIPQSAEAIEASAPDAASDTEDPVFPVGFRFDRHNATVG